MHGLGVEVARRQASQPSCPAPTLLVPHRAPASLLERRFVWEVAALYWLSSAVYCVLNYGVLVTDCGSVDKMGG